MEDKQEIMNSIWEKVEELEAVPSNKKNKVSIPNKTFAMGICGLIFLAVSIAIIGEMAYWMTLCLVPVAYLIDQYSWMEEIRNRETKLFDL